MVRAFAACVLILAAGMASAQTVTPRIIPQPEPDETLGIAAPEPTPVSACGEHDCPNSSIASADKPVDKHALLKQKLAEMNCLQSEIDQLRAATGTPQQILVKIQAVEISRTKLQKVGIDISALHGDDRANSLFQSPQPPPESASFVGFAAINDTASVTGLIDKLRQNKVAKVLAEPNLVAISGRPASFNVGGEIPLPATPGSNQVVEFKPYGTQVDVLAVAQGNHRVRLELRARVSEVDNSKQIQLAGVTVPSVSVRQIDTGVDLKFGQTGVFSGMVQKHIVWRKFENKVVNDVNEIELLFLVTPELVASADSPLHAATSDAGSYRTATSDSEDRPAERSLRVTPRAAR